MSLTPGDDGKIKTFGKVCPFCEKRGEYQSILEEGVMQGEDLKKLRYKLFKLGHMRSHLLYVVDRENESDGWKRMFAPEALFNAIFNAYINQAARATGCSSKDEFWEKVNDGADFSDIPDVFDVDKGFDVVLTKTKDEQKNRINFSATIAERPSPLSNVSNMAVIKATMEDPTKFITTDITDNIDFYAPALANLEVELTRQRTNLAAKTKPSDDDDLPPPPQQKVKPVNERTTPSRSSSNDDDDDSDPEPTFVDPEDAEFINQPVKSGGGTDDARKRLAMLSEDEG